MPLITCQDCHVQFNWKHTRKIRCNDCGKSARKTQLREAQQRFREKSEELPQLHVLSCQDCSITFRHKSMKKKRCNECQQAFHNKICREAYQKKHDVLAPVEKPSDPILAQLKPEHTVKYQRLKEKWELYRSLFVIDSPQFELRYQAVYGNLVDKPTPLKASQLMVDKAYLLFRTKFTSEDGVVPSLNTWRLNLQKKHSKYHLLFAESAEVSRKFQLEMPTYMAWYEKNKWSPVVQKTWEKYPDSRGPSPLLYKPRGFQGL